MNTSSHVPDAHGHTRSDAARLILRRGAPRRAILLPALVLGGALLAGCSSGVGQAAETGAQLTNAGDVFTGELSPDAVLAENEDYTTVNDDEWSIDDAGDIALTGTTAETDAEGVEVDGGTVTIGEAGVNRLSGKLSGQIVVDAAESSQVTLVLDDAQISSDEGPAIEVVSADDVALYLVDGSENTVSDAATYADGSDGSAAIDAYSDLTISGAGALTVTGNSNDGISSTDDLVVLDGRIDVTAVDDGLRGKDALAIEGGEIRISAEGGDALKSDQDEDEARGYILVTGGTITATAGDDGLQAQTDMVITGGDIEVRAADDGVKGEAIVSIGGGDVNVAESTEGIEAAAIWLGGGAIDVTSSDDGANAAGATTTQTETSGEGEPAAPEEDPDAEASSTGAPSADAPPAKAPEVGGDLAMAPGGQGPGGGGFADTGQRLEIAGGTLTVDAEGDGLDSNGSLTVTGGETVIYGPTNSGNGALDANGEITVNGGLLTAFGAGGMEEAPGSESEQGWVMIQAEIAAGDEVEVVGDTGDTVTTVTAKKAAGTVIYAGDAIEPEASYTARSGGTEIGTAVAGEGAGAGGAGAGMPGGPGQGAARDGEMPGARGGAVGDEPQEQPTQ